jgi:hypothetical protein
VHVAPVAIAQNSVLLPYGDGNSGIDVSIVGVGPDGRTTYVASATDPNPDTPVPSE